MNRSPTRVGHVAKLLSAACIALLLPVSAGAHQLQHVLSELRWFPDSGRLEVTHSLHMDDALLLLDHLGLYQGDLDARAQARVLHYVEQRFRLSAHGSLLPLEPVGAQFDGDILWIYQELEMPVLSEALQVECRLMWELFVDQQNQINLAVGSQVRSLYLGRGPDGVRRDSGVFEPS